MVSGSSLRMVTAPRVREGSGGRLVEAADAAGRFDQLLEADLQRLRRLDQHRQRRIGGARLERGPGGAGHAGQLGDLLLGLPARLAQRLDVAAEVGGRVLAVGRHAPAEWHLVGILANMSVYGTGPRRLAGRRRET
jgi:hypothetical protein